MQGVGFESLKSFNYCSGNSHAGKIYFFKKTWINSSEALLRLVESFSLSLDVLRLRL